MMLGSKTSPLVAEAAVGEDVCANVQFGHGPNADRDRCNQHETHPRFHESPFSFERSLFRSSRSCLCANDPWDSHDGPVS